MGRILMVTRTINVTKVTYRIANPETETFETKEMNLSGSFKGNTEKMYKALKSELKSEGIKAEPYITSFEESSDLYGMTEKEFLDHAQKLDPRKTKTE